MLKTRIITAVTGITILLGVLYLGGIYWKLLIGLLAFMALYEYFAMMRNKGYNPLVLPAYLIAAVLLFRVTLAPFMSELFFVSLFIMILVLIVKYPRFSFNELVLSFFGAFYCGYLFSFAIALGELSRAFHYVLLVFILTWASDVGGYMFGRLWGKHKLTPLLSPGKTWEGAIGAIVLTISLALLYKQLVFIGNLGVAYMVFLGLLASVVAQIGDLLESAMKRYFGVKDSGNIIPGHGGVLDRFDSFMLLLPLVSYFLVVLK
jgi:phosphatidate cytidylyltransferase